MLQILLFTSRPHPLSPSHVSSSSVPFRFALCFAFGPVRWHCNAYSLFRSCRADRISHFLLYKLCDWWQSWTTYCVTFEWRKESQICAGKKYICRVVVPVDSLNCNYLNKSRHNAIVRFEDTEVSILVDFTWNKMIIKNKSLHISLGKNCWTDYPSWEELKLQSNTVRMLESGSEIKGLINKQLISK